MCVCMCMYVCMHVFCARIHTDEGRNGMRDRDTARERGRDRDREREGEMCVGRQQKEHRYSGARY